MGAYDRLAPRYDRVWGHYARTTAREVLEALPTSDIGTLLDVGCGTGTLLALARERFPAARLVGAEPSVGMRGQAARTLAGQGVTLLAAPAEALGLPDGSVDVLTCLNVLHYLHDPAAALREWRRVLRPGGTLVVQDYVPNGLPGFTRLAALNDRDLVRVYTAPEMGELLETADFGAVTAHRFRIDLFWRGGLARGVRRSEADPERR